MNPRKYPSGNCRHCGIGALLRPRGLCSAHYEDRAVRALYPPKPSPSNNRGSGLDPVAGVVPYSLPPRPTLAAPGTHEKLLVFAARARNRQSLFHPRDVNHLNWTALPEMLPLQTGDRSGAGGRSRGKGGRTCSRCRRAQVEPGSDFRCCQVCRENMAEGHRLRKKKAASG